jgi:hypothetical protein
LVRFGHFPGAGLGCSTTILLAIYSDTYIAMRILELIKYKDMETSLSHCGSDVFEVDVVTVRNICRQG